MSELVTALQYHRSLITYFLNFSKSYLRSEESWDTFAVLVYPELTVTILWLHISYF